MTTAAWSTRCSRPMAGLPRASFGSRSCTIQRSFIGSTSEILPCIWPRPVIVSRLPDYCWRLAPTQTPRKITAEAARCITLRTVSSVALHGMRKGRWKLSGTFSAKVPTSICKIRTALLPCTARSERVALRRCDVFSEPAVTRRWKTNPGPHPFTSPCKTLAVVERAPQRQYVRRERSSKSSSPLA